MSANCCKYSGLQSVLAPISMTRQAPSLVGRVPPRAGRSTPGMRLSVKREAAIIAPLLPAETAPSAAPSRTYCSATVIDAFFLRRTGWQGVHPSRWLHQCGRWADRDLAYCVWQVLPG